MGLTAALVNELDSVGDWGLLTTDSQLVITGWNRWLERHSGQSSDSVLGRPLFDVFPDLQRRRFDSHYAQALFGKTVLLSQQLHRYLLPLPATSAGQRFHNMQQSARIVPLQEGGRVQGTVTILEDVTERVASESELRERIATLRDQETRLRASEARYRALLDTAHEGIWHIDQDGYAAYVNEQMAHMLGCTVAEILGRKVHEFVFPEDLEEAQQRIRNNFEGRHEQFDFRFRRKDGNVLHVLASSNPLRDGTGNIIGAFAMFADITERQWALRTLEESERRLRALFNHQFQFSGLLTPTGEIADLSASAYRQSGLSREELIGQSFLEAPWFRDLPESKAIWQKQFAEALASPVSSRVEAPFHSGDGSLRWAINTVTAVRDDKSDLQYLLVEGIDITDRKRAEQSLQKREAFITSILASLTDAVIVFDREFRCTYINGEMHRRLGKPPDEDLTGQTLEQLFRGPGGDIPCQKLHEAMAHRTPVEYEVEFPTMGIWLSDKAYPIADNGLLVISRDITARKRSQDRLQESEGKFRVLFESLPLGVFLIEPGTQRILDCNEQAARSLGYSREQLCRMRIPEIEAKYSDAETEAMNDRIVHHGEHLSFQTRHRTASGEVREVIMTACPIVVNEQTLSYASALDITDRVRAENALHDADRRKDEFLATLAHELRNPLAPIRNGLQILRQSSDRDACERAREMMERQLSHLIHLVDDLLDLSRISLGKIELRREPITAAEIVEAALEASRPVVETHRHELRVELPAESLRLEGDRTRLVQVVANLITNAAKYTEDGGRISILAKRDGPQMLLSVTDTGVGLDPETIPTLWNMFSQVRDTLEKAQGGLGIGLSLVKSLVEMHGGSVAAESPGPGQGSTFTIRLPLLNTAFSSSHVEQPTPSRHVSSTAHRVLIIDDNKDGADSLAMMLHMFGHETALAYSGSDAVNAARVFRPDIVICDIGLPGMNGYEVARCLRADPTTRQACLIALTGWGTDEDKRRSQDAGFDLHLTKPVEAIMVRDALSRFARYSEGGIT